MTEPLDLARTAAAELAARTGVSTYDVAVTLGSGWKSAVDSMGDVVAEIPADQIPGFSISGVAGHAGTLCAVRLTNHRHTLVIGARTHLYEGRGVDAVVHGVRTAAAAGARAMILTNGAGALNRSYVPGQAVLVNDHLNLTATSPLRGATFVDLTDLYSASLRKIARAVDPTLGEGVYVQLTGPQYETPAEVRMLRSLGGDMVGMSTALEAIAARTAHMPVLGLSLITNLAAGIRRTPLDHSEVLEAGRAAETTLGPLLAAIVTRVSDELQ